MTFFCGSAVVATLASGITSAPLQEAAGMIVVPFEKSITTIGLWLTDINKSFQEKQDLIDQNEELKNTVDTLTEQNNILIQNQSELSRLQELYDLDAEYSDHFCIKTGNFDTFIHSIFQRCHSGHSSSSLSVLHIFSAYSAHFLIFL